ncbi:hypothetical protein L1887_16246 [Cichorium endivia]|nr:hypothetical protein L1887_16246 [Cichorium endivia]
MLRIYDHQHGNTRPEHDPGLCLGSLRSRPLASHFCSSIKVSFCLSLFHFSARTDSPLLLSTQASGMGFEFCVLKQFRC